MTLKEIKEVNKIREEIKRLYNIQERTNMTFEKNQKIQNEIQKLKMKKDRIFFNSKMREILKNQQ